MVSVRAFAVADRGVWLICYAAGELKLEMPATAVVCVASVGAMVVLAAATVTAAAIYRSNHLT